ncbi:VOC family protein [Dyadobacter arcticus]|uniref:Glyoxalase superfamily protein PhnB n=1 Tax=Dyadobacter arcticus TaxID=1078754 RepID=A0ABX0UKW6_9BACT|nr:VOC family protein [Dyadobacter arcticus]NIJ52644.1 putative glyoxalase superfamily protein PhnB [Dyadobacter arcticus]
MKAKNSSRINTIPDSYTAVTPWLISESSEKLITFMEAVFGAEEVPNSKIKNEEGVVIHVVVKIGDAMVMLFDSREGWNPTPSFLNVYVDDIEKSYEKALDLGSKSVTDITSLWFGEKVCRILDPFGNLWWINERVENIDPTDPKEAQKRSSTPEAIKNVEYIQKSLNEAMRIQQEFLA